MQSSSDPAPCLVRVSPERAAGLVASSPQRFRWPGKVEGFAKAMWDGRWEPERHRLRPVVVERGRLRQGHHRMSAVVLCGLTVPMWVREVE